MSKPMTYLPQRAPVLDGDTHLMSKAWLMALQAAWQQITTTGDVDGPSISTNGQIVLFNGSTGKVIKGATGTGVVHATSGVYSVALVNLTTEVTDRLPYANLTAATAGSELLGRRSTGSGDWEVVTLGSGLTMSSSAVLNTVSGADYVVMGDGANPPTPMNDGAGNFLYIGYTP